MKKCSIICKICISIHEEALHGRLLLTVVISVILSIRHHVSFLWLPLTKHHEVNGLKTTLTARQCSQRHGSQASQPVTLGTSPPTRAPAATTAARQEGACGTLRGAPEHLTGDHVDCSSEPLRKLST